MPLHSGARHAHLQPDNAIAVTQLAWLLATCPTASLRSGREAVELAQHAVKLTGRRDAVAFDALGAAYAETGRFADAVEAVRKPPTSPCDRTRRP